MTKKTFPKPFKYVVKNKHKYKGDPNKVVARSKLESKYFKYCDNNPNIKFFSSEEVVVPYVSRIDGKVHRYFVDLYLETIKGDKYLIEIKPKSQCSKPRKSKKKSRKTILYEQKTYIVNQCKWEAAKKYAEKRGWKFIVLTEHDIR